MTPDDISTAWERALHNADIQVRTTYTLIARDREMRAEHSLADHLLRARSDLETFFHLQRTICLRAPSALVHSLGASSSLLLGGFQPWDTLSLAQYSARRYTAGVAHADPPIGDGNLLAWIGATHIRQQRKEVLDQVVRLFGITRSDITKEGSDMTSAADTSDSNVPWWEEEVQGAYWKPEGGRHRVEIVGEPEYRVNSFGRRNLDIPTSKGILSTTQRTILGPLAAHARTHKGRLKGVTLAFTSNGAAGVKVRYEKVEVK